MKIIYKVFAALMVLPLLAGMTSCTEEAEYDAAKSVGGPQVYFSTELPSTIDVSENETHAAILLSRVVTEGEVTVPLKVETESEFISLPSSVTFADGEASAEITIMYDLEKMEMGVYDDVVVSLDDETYTTPYGRSSYAFSIGLPAPWTSLGYGLYYEDILGPLYGGSPLEYAVEIEENDMQPGMFRLVNPYGADYPYNEEGDWDDTENHYLVIDATDPDHVWFTKQYMGVDWGDGELYMQSLVDFEMEYGSTLEEIKNDYPELFGTYKDGVITMPKSSIYAYLAGLPVEDGYWWYGNENGLFRIAMPGVVVKDYSVFAEYTGRFVDTDSNSSAVFNVTLGEDVEYVKYALVDADLAQDAVDGIVNGTVEADILQSSGELRLPVETSGDYALVTVAYADAEVCSSDYITFRFVENSVKETWTLINAGTYQFATDYMEGEQAASLYCSDTDPSRFKIAPFGDDGELIFTWNKETGDCEVLPSNTGYDMGEYGLVSVQELQTAYPDYYYETSYYDAESATFWFNVIYRDETNYYYGFGWESFQIASETEVAPRQSKLQMKSKRNFSRLKLRPVGLVPGHKVLQRK